MRLIRVIRAGLGTALDIFNPEKLLCGTVVPCISSYWIWICRSVGLEIPEL